MDSLLQLGHPVEEHAEGHHDQVWAWKPAIQQMREGGWMVEWWKGEWPRGTTIRCGPGRSGVGLGACDARDAMVR